MKKIIGILIGILIIVIIGYLIFNNNNKEELYNNGVENIWSDNQNVNEPLLLEGMNPISFEEGNEKPSILSNEETIQGIWYDYIDQAGTTEEGGTSKWANAMTQDGSMWVWIPRYAYKIEWDDKEKVGKIDIIFLKGTTNYNKENVDVTTMGYKVHPAFMDGKNNGYKNGEWDEEISGIWVSKFEAGYAGQKNTASEKIEILETELCYKRDTKNVIGTVEENKTHMTYPVFIGKTYSYNNIEVGEMYDLSKALNAKGNPYGFSEVIDSHLMKNSEWGAVVYLAHSKYGRNGTKVSINNLYASEIVKTAGTVTGYAGKNINSGTNNLKKSNKKLAESYNDSSYAWYTKQGTLGSTTGNIYGIYDMNGGASEYTAGYIKGINKDLGNFYAKSMMENTSSSKYCTVYEMANNKENNATLQENYEANKDVYGDAIYETSKKGTGYNSWNGETSMYIGQDVGFLLRSGGYNRVHYSGLFDFTNHSGHSSEYYGFRCVLIG